MLVKKPEIWKPINGYEGLYEISNHGNVKSLSRLIHMKQLNCKPYFDKPERLLKFDTSGYYRVTLCKDNKTKRFLVHRLVAKHFIENTNGYKIVNHKDRDYTNNYYLNLEWCNWRENNTHMIDKSKTTSMYTGVFYKNEKYRIKKWSAQVRHKNKIHFLGYYDTEEEASEAYVSYLKEYDLINKYAKKATD
jgi:hypothetical protein